jgi:4-hydroxy-2-oxoheptanedioate aldolase
MGVAFGSDAHNAAIERILAAAHKHNKTAAIFCSNGEQARARLAQGFDMVSVTTDIGCIVGEMTRQLAVATGTIVEKKGGGYT